MNVEIPEALNIVPMSPATYPQINEYIMEKYGVKVHSNFIAEVKRKCGLDMRKNYNLARSGESIKRHCTKEKEEYIMEALRHFGMIR